MALSAAMLDFLAPCPALKHLRKELTRFTAVIKGEYKAPRTGDTLGPGADGQQTQTDRKVCRPSRMIRRSATSKLSCRTSSARPNSGEINH